MLLETPRREHSEAVDSSRRLDEECHGLRADLLLQIDMVTERDEVIRQLRDQAGAQWESGWLAFQQKAIRVYSNLDFDFDVPSDGEAEESFSANESPGPSAQLRPPLIPHRLKLKAWGWPPCFFFARHMAQYLYNFFFNSCSFLWFFCRNTSIFLPEPFHLNHRSFGILDCIVLNCIYHAFSWLPS